MTIRTQAHTLVGFANPYLICEECRSKVPYWHNPDRCFCDSEYYNSPCGHTSDVISKCPTWSPVDGCGCEDKETHDRK